MKIYLLIIFFYWCVSNEIGFNKKDIEKMWGVEYENYVLWIFLFNDWNGKWLMCDDWFVYYRKFVVRFNCRRSKDRLVVDYLWI